MSSSEIQCPNCFHPAVPAPPLARPVANLSTHHFSYRDGLSQTSLVVADHGAVPVIHGDPKWLPEKVRAWVCEKVLLMRPSEIYICCGSVFEAQLMMDMLLKKGVLEKCHSLDNVYVARTDPQDTVRMEKNTYIVTSRKDEVEANRRSDSACELARWMSRAHAADELEARFPGCMRGRTMYVVPFSMGPIAGQFSKNAVHITDSPYVVLNMRVVSSVPVDAHTWWKLINNIQSINGLSIEMCKARYDKAVQFRNVWFDSHKNAAISSGIYRETEESLNLVEEAQQAAEESLSNLLSNLRESKNSENFNYSERQDKTAESDFNEAFDELERAQNRVVMARFHFEIADEEFKKYRAQAAISSVHLLWRQFLFEHVCTHCRLIAVDNSLLYYTRLTGLIIPI